MPLIKEQWRQFEWRKIGWKWPLAAVCAALPILALFASNSSEAVYPQKTHQETLPIYLPASPQNSQKTETRSATVRKGYSAGSALYRLGFSSRDVLEIASTAKKLHPLTRILPGKTLVRTDSSSSTTITLQIDGLHRLQISRPHADAPWSAKITTSATTSRWLTASGTIQNNLFVDAANAGLDDRTTMNLVNIFGWDIDFARNLRQGDRFKVLLNEMFDDQGKRITSTILAAEFTNRGKTYRAIRFKTANNSTAYYAPNGTSMRKNYLKAPVKFSRISSRFQLARKHPILGYTRAHRGVDYAAPTGTPIHAIGAGRITFRGWSHGYGNFILIRHRNRNYSSAYGHMRRFAKGQHKGSWVKQGQVIGYVGMTGLATGPHLHFEFRVRGRAINPLSIKRAPAQPVPTKLRASFKKQRSQMLLALTNVPLSSKVAWQ